MNKLKKQILGLGIIVFILIAAIILVFLPGNKKEIPAGTEILQQISTDQIASITVENESGTYTAIQDKDHTLIMEGYESLSLNDDTIISLFHYASYIRGQIAVKNENNSLETYGLAAPVSRVKVTCTNGENYTLDIGNPVPGQSTADSLYILYEDNIYTTYKLHVEPFLLSKTDYIQQEITPVSLSSDDPNVSSETMLSITQATISRDDWTHPVTIQKQANQDVMGYSLQLYTISLDGSYNYEYTTDSIGNQLLNSFFNLTADSIVSIHPDDAVLEQYGLLDPYFEANIVYQDASGNVDEFSFLCSKFIDGVTYIKNEAVDVIYSINLEPAFLSVNSNELISSYLLTPDINTLQSMKIETTTDTYEFTINSDNNSLQSVEMNHETIIPEVFQTFYQTLIATKADQVLVETSIPKNASLEASVTYLYNDNSEQKLLLYYKSERELYAYIDDSHVYTVNQTKWANILDLIELLQPAKH